MASQVDIHLPDGVLQALQNFTIFVGEGVNSFTNSAQQVGESLKTNATQTTNKAIDTVTTSLEEAKGSLEQSWQTAEQVKNTTSAAVKDAIAEGIGGVITDSVNNWLIQHPTLLRLIQILNWAVNHPIISLVILLFGLALIWSIIKAIIRLIETASWSILQLPLKLISSFLKISFLSLTKVSSLVIQKITPAKQTDNTQLFLPTDTQMLSQNKQQRLAEISNRLAVIQQEQKELLQEAADLIASDTMDIKLPKIKLSR
ncbi:hypothetical protein I8748_33710 [Nostoc sp. CENA67]|uniref:Uncharacterized protein n=1 Tax=Amazonocrinis nigriterrae CENA67 TaxID=2794033 RepID=A0A8J7I0I5_9NOST|nr:hypothetical protein [Amazonocrinis nigriterrae]MBH8567050.1 hypothetical protein [Amazonocrinis nigriterrae CENA67]